MPNKSLDRFFSRMDQMETAITFEDVILLPRMSSIVPRDVCLDTMITRNVPLKIPLASADMDKVTKARMAIALAKLGGIGFIHRNMTPDEQADEVDKVKFTLNALIESPICLRPDNTLDDLYRTRDEYDGRFSSFLITDGSGRLAGLVTKDQTKYCGSSDGSIPLSSLMIQNPFSIKGKVKVNEAYGIMKAQKLSKLIMTDSGGKVIGLYCWEDVKDIVEGVNPIYNRDSRGQLRVGASIGVLDFERAEKLLQKHVDVILVGTAHGHSENVGDTVRELKTKFRDYEFDVLAGNVATEEGARYLVECGADGIKVGIGPGSICTTRIVAGVGVPQLTAVYESIKGAGDAPACADGGLKYSGDMAKALAIGAKSLMCGSLFAATEESPGEIVIINGKPHKAYRGMGSIEAMREYKQSRERYKKADDSPEKLVPEGISGAVPVKGSVEDLVVQLVGGIKSSFGYLGAHNLEEFQANASLKMQTSAGKRESHPHDITITSEAPNYQVPDGE